MSEQTPPLIKFPSDFTLKVMGKTDSAFEQVVLKIVRQYFPTLSNEQISKRLSKDDNYLALSITVYAESKEQLDKLYLELTSTKEVIMAL